MSAYVVDSATIDRIVTFVDTKVAQEWSGLQTELCHAAGATTPQQLGQALLCMNVDAVEGRYRHKEATPIYHYTPRTASDVQVYKTLQCFLYQCDEGDVAERPLYRAVERLKDYCADGIVGRLPEYDKAAWG